MSTPSITHKKPCDYAGHNYIYIAQKDVIFCCDCGDIKPLYPVPIAKGKEGDK